VIQKCSFVRSWIDRESHRRMRTVILAHAERSPAEYSDGRVSVRDGRPDQTSVGRYLIALGLRVSSAQLRK
jgi:hypothetical protein